jgi:hypothetical protein
MRLAATFSIVFWCAAQSASAGLIDTFTRSDVSPVTDSLGTTEAGGFVYVERGNNASGSTVDGTAEISNNKLLITGAQQTTSAAYLNVGGTYLSGYNSADAKVGLDLAFVLTGNAPSGMNLANDNRFNNTFLLMLRSRVGQNFGTGVAEHAGLVAIELDPNGDILVREQRATTGLASVQNLNPFTGAAAVRQPLPGILPTTYGSGSFDVNQNGYLDADEPIHFEAELVGTSLKLFINGLQYGNTATLAQTSVPAGQANGIGLHKNRIGSTFLVGSNLLIDNLQVTPVPEPAALAVSFVGLCLGLASRIRTSRA